MSSTTTTTLWCWQVYCFTIHHHGTATTKTTSTSNAIRSSSSTRLYVTDGTAGMSGPPYSGPAVKPILDTIHSPADMKRLDMRQLKQVRYVLSLSLSACIFD